MTRTLEDLRGALQDEADSAAYPDVDALVAGARRRVVDSRRRRLAVFGAVTAAVLVVGGLVMTRPTHEAVPPPAGPGPFVVNSAGADFPEYQQGMKRLIVVDAPMLERMKGSISVPTTPGRRLAVRMTCTPTDSVDNVDLLANFTTPGGTSGAACGMAIGGHNPIGVATDAKTTVLADVTVSHEPSPSLPSLKDAKIHVAIYESVPWQDYPLPPRPADLNTNPQYAWSNEPGTVRVLGPKTAREANKPVTFTQPFDPKLSVNLEVRGPGRIRVLVNGKDITERIGGSMTLTEDKSMSFWGYGNSGLQGIGDPFGPVLKSGTPVTVTIEPQDFQGPDWRIAVQPSPPSG